MAASVLQTNGAQSGNTITMSAYTAGSYLIGFNTGRGGGHTSRSGWTHLGDWTAGADKLCSLWRASAGESASFAFTNVDGTGGRTWVSEILGVGDPLTPVTSSSNTTSFGNDTLTRNGVLAGSLLMGGVCGNAADVWAGGLWTPPAGWTETQDLNIGGHPFPWGGYIVASTAGNYSMQPVHANNWNGWDPRGESMVMVEFPVLGGARSYGAVL